MTTKRRSDFHLPMNVCFGFRAFKLVSFYLMFSPISNQLKENTSIQKFANQWSLTILRFTNNATDYEIINMVWTYVFGSFQRFNHDSTIPRNLKIEFQTSVKCWRKVLNGEKLVNFAFYVRSIMAIFEIVIFCSCNNCGNRDMKMYKLQVMAKMLTKYFLFFWKSNRQQNTAYDLCGIWVFILTKNVLNVTVNCVEKNENYPTNFIF